MRGKKKKSNLTFDSVTVLRTRVYRVVYRVRKHVVMFTVQKTDAGFCYESEFTQLMVSATSHTLSKPPLKVTALQSDLSHLASAFRARLFSRAATLTDRRAFISLPASEPVHERSGKLRLDRPPSSPLMRIVRIEKLLFKFCFHHISI